MSYRFVARARRQRAARPVVIGTGPCGLFAALILAQMGFRPIILERGKVVRERTKDTWGFWRKAVLDPESNVQFGEGGAGTFSDGKLYSQIKDPHHLGRKVLTEFVKAGAPEEILYVAKPHIGTFRLVTMVESLREHDRGARRRVSLRLPGRRSRYRGRATASGSVRGVVLADGTHRGGGSRRAGGRPQRARHVRDAARARRRDRGEAVLHRRAHRASAVADRPLPLRRRRRPSAARRRRLQAGASRRERALGLQLLHVPGRHGGRGDLGAGPRRHQRHEPVFARRAQRQCRHRRRHHAGGLSGRSARRHRVPAPLGGARLRGRRLRPTRRRRSASAISSPARPRPRSARSCRPTGPASRRPISPTACRTTRSRRSARRCRSSTGRSRASRSPTR